VSAHYGLTKRWDAGVRVRPFSRGAKLETLVQLLHEKRAGVGLAVGLGVDGFWRAHAKVECSGDGCFSQGLRGLITDTPVILSMHLWRHGTAFVGGRYQHLFLWGEQRFAAPGRPFAPLVVETATNQWIAGWLVGVEIDGFWWRLTPQMGGSTVRLPGGKIAHILTPAIEVGVDLDL
jgi:hypothetical protein